MNYLVGKLILGGGEHVVITFSDGSKVKGVYMDTYGYNHLFKLDNGKELKLSNHFMHLKDIDVALDKNI